jgi:RNA polymerase primary sigma factor
LQFVHVEEDLMGQTMSHALKTPNVAEETRRDASPAILPLYLREMATNPLIDADEEVRLSREMQSARRAMVRLVQRLPADCLREIAAADGHADELGPAWSLAGVERFYDRLKSFAEKTDDTTVVDVLNRARVQKRHLEEAREKLILANLKLVVHIAKRYGDQGVPLLDLIQEGNIGLLRAVEKFEYQRGNKFSTYAYWWIKQAIDRAIVDRGRVIRIPAHLNEMRRKVARVVTRLRQRHGEHPTLEEIAAASGLSVEQVENVMGLVLEPQSLEQHAAERGDLSQTVEDPEAPSPLGNAERVELVLKTRAALESLKPREAEVIRMRFGIEGSSPHTLDEIGRKLSLSRERVRQIQVMAMKHLHDMNVLADLVSRRDR